MANMSYCRFRNTLTDLQDCYDNMDDNDLSREEMKARDKIIKLCESITEDYGCIDDDDDRKHFYINED
jgi:hypothetical protein